MNVGIGSEFEQSIRYLILIYAIGEAMPEDRICSLDFITTYAADFGIGSNNLHGSSGYRFGEFTSRAFTAKESLLYLALHELIKVSLTDQGCVYEITNAGNDFVNALHSSYVGMYLNIADSVNLHFQNVSTKDLHKIVTQRIQESVRVNESYES